MTESTDSHRVKAPISTARRLTVALMVLVAGLSIIALAWPRLIVGVSDGPLDEILHSLSTTSPAPEQAIQRTLELKKSSVLVHGNAKTWADIGLLQLRDSLQLGPLSPDGTEALEASIAAHQTALTFNPRNAYVWTRLGQDLLIRDGATAKNLGSILQVAVQFAPYDSRLVVARVDLSLAAWEQLPDPVHALMDDQIHIAARQSPTSLAKLARERLALSRVTGLLADDSDLLKRFIYAYTHS